MADIDAVWEAASAEALRQIDTGDEPTAIVECVRIALLESGMRSWAATRTPSIVARAVEVGLWTPARALALADIIPADEQSIAVDLMAAIIGTGVLAPDDAHGVVDKAMTLVKSWEFVSGYDSTFRKLMESSLRYARDDVVEAALATALKAADQDIYGRSDESPALYSLMPLLPEQLAEAALTGILELQNPAAQIWALARLIPRLSDERRYETLSRALDAVERIDDLNREIDPSLPEYEKTIRLETQVRLDPDHDETRKALAIEQLGAYLTGGLAERALKIVLSLRPSAWYISRATGQLAHALTDEQWARLAEHSPEVFSRKELNITQPLPDIPQTVDSDRWFFDVIETEDDEEERARRLAWGAERIRDYLLPKLVDHVLEFVEHPFYREWVFGSVASRLDTQSIQRILTAKFDHVSMYGGNGCAVTNTLTYMGRWAVTPLVKQELIDYVLDRILAHEWLEPRAKLIEYDLLPHLADGDIWRTVQMRKGMLMAEPKRPPSPFIKEKYARATAALFSEQTPVDDEPHQPMFEEADQSDRDYRLERLSDLALEREKFLSNILFDCCAFEPPFFSREIAAAIAREIVVADQSVLGDYAPI